MATEILGEVQGILGKDEKKKKKEKKEESRASYGDDDDNRDWRGDYKALKKSTAAEIKELQALREQFTVPVTTYEDKDRWKEACKFMEREVEEFCKRSMKDPGNQFGVRVLGELEEMMTTQLHNLLQGKHRQYCELKAKEIRTALQAASNAYIERVRDESGFQLTKPYPDFCWSVAKHMLLGVQLEITQSKNFRLGKLPDEVLELEKRTSKLRASSKKNGGA
ncbi:unnamed protein product [Amoebophrya sp. A25]|nr:unnamed protein product [Amoebophrya sp. A25]|eukprot:GSA25T00002450001.1